MSEGPALTERSDAGEEAPTQPQARRAFADFAMVREALQGEIIGQDGMVRDMILCLVCGGHLMIEGIPGLAKTRAVKALAGLLGMSFARLQFTPDMLPSDITGAEALEFSPQTGLPTGQASFRPGPIFSQLVLADEINRAPAKVQSALLEAMEEQQVSAGGVAHPLPQPFMVAATMNPVDHQGTWQLPQAQLDRFLLQTAVDYPAPQDERRILEKVREEDKARLAEAKGAAEAQRPALGARVIMQARGEVLEVFCAEAVQDYILALATATRKRGPHSSEPLQRWIERGVSPRGAIALERASRAHAWLEQRDYTTPDDVQRVLPEVFRHRLHLSVDALAEGVGADKVAAALLDAVPSL